MNALAAWHRSLGATLAADGIPLDYGDQDAEFKAALETSILLDRSHEGRILLIGLDRFELVNRMSTNNLIGLKLYEGRPTVFTNAHARILYRVMSYSLPEGLLLITEPGQGNALANYLRRNIFFGDKAELRELSAQTAHFAIHGAAADAVMASLHAELADLPPLFSAEIEAADAQLTAARRKSIAGQHWILVCQRHQAVAVHRHLLQVGQAAGLKPAGSLTYNVLRIRSGRPAGLELGPDYLPLEVGLWDEVSFNKGCYTGQEIIARMESRRRLAKTIVKLDLSAFVQATAAVYDRGRPVGKLTSSVQALNQQIFALAVIKTASASRGTELEVGPQRIAAKVIGCAGQQPAFIFE